MIIVADENIPFAREAFSPLGEVRLVHGRKMTAETVKDATLLLVRSITKVNEALLKGSAVRFVATATIGTDHVDEAYLRREGIKFSSAPGSNSNSVSEYITAALLVIAKRRGYRLEGREIGVVGVGNVGSKVAAKAEALGMKVMLCDPPLRRATGDEKYRPLEELFDCDALTFHVPLYKEGPEATYHLINSELLKRLKPGAVVLNSSRGAVADNAALLGALKEGSVRDAVLDVWEGEPRINVDLLAHVAIGTPHIAGYSYDGKVNGTEMIYCAACEFLGRKPDWRLAEYMPAPEVPEIALDGVVQDVEDALRDVIEKVYSIERDDAGIRATAGLSEAERGPAFDRLRKEYPRRREFQNTVVRLSSVDPRLRAKLSGIGFKIA